MFLITPLFQILFLLIIFQFSAVSAQTFGKYIVLSSQICKGRGTCKKIFSNSCLKWLIEW